MANKIDLNDLLSANVNRNTAVELLRRLQMQSPDAVDRNRPTTLPSQMSALPSSFQSQGRPLGSPQDITKLQDLFGSAWGGLNPTIGSLGIKPPTPVTEGADSNDRGLKRKPQMTQESARDARNYASANAAISTIGGIFQPAGPASKILSGAKAAGEAGVKLTSAEAAKLAEAAQIEGGLAGRIGARGSVAGDIAKEGAGPAQTPAQRAGLGGTGGQAPSPPGGPTFSAGQFPESVQGDLAQIQKTPGFEKLRPTISLSEQAQLASEIDQPLAALMDDLAKVGPGKLSPKIIAVNERIAGLIQSTQEYRTAIANGTASEADKLNFAVNLKQAILGRAAAVGATSEAARAVGAQGKIPIRSVLGKTEQAINEAINKAALEHPEKFDQIAQQIMDLSSNPKKLLAYTRQMGEQPGFWDKFFEYYRANVLWNVATHVTNTTSGVAQVGLYVSREAIKNPRSLKYVPELAKGYAQAAANLLPERMQNWLSSHAGVFEDLADNVALTAASDKYGGITHPRGAIGGSAIGNIAGPIVRVPFTVLKYADLFQTKPLFNFALKIKAEALGKARGLRGQALKDFVNKIPEEDFNQVAEAAMNDAHEFALHSTGTLSKALQQFKEASPINKALILFVNTPINLAKIGGRFSPAGALRIPAALLSKEGRTQLPNIVAEATIGSGITAGFLALLGSDNMTGLTPKTPAEKTLWEAEGRQAMSIRASEYPILSPVFKTIYGDNADKTWVSVNFLGPLLYPALIAGAVSEATRDGQEITADHAIVASAAVGQTVLNTLPLFQSYQGINNLLSNPSTDTVLKFLANLAKPVIPAESGLAMIERMKDGFKRDPKDLFESMKVLIPGVGESVRKDYDVLGRPIRVQQGAAGLLSRASTENPSPVLTEDRRLRDANPNFSGLNKPSPTIGSGTTKIEFDADTFNQYEQLAGQAKEQALTKMMADPKYRAMTVGEQSKEFEKVESAAQASALRALGMTLAQSNDAQRVSTGVRLAIHSGSNYDKGTSLAAIRDRLTPTVKAQVDAARTQPDPSKDNYQLSVDEYLRGAEIRSAWDRAPHFVFGTPTEWQTAERAAEQYKALIKGKTAAQRKDDLQALRFYNEGAGGLLATYFESDGSRRTKYVSAQRITIEKDKLWSRFSP